MTVRSLGSALRTFSYSVIALANLPCWTNFSAALKTFCLLKPKPKAIKVLTPARKLYSSPCSATRVTDGPTIQSALGPGCARDGTSNQGHCKAGYPESYGY